MLRQVLRLVYEVSQLYLPFTPGPSTKPAERRCILLPPRTEPARPVNAFKLIRRINERSTTWLISGDDGNLYIIKFAGNPSCPNALAHETLWTALAESVGLPVAPAAAVSVSLSFLEENPSLSFIGPKGSWPKPGLHYGSRFVGEVSGSSRPLEYLLRRDLVTISNRSDFLGMYILDVWATRQKSRKAIFLKDNETGRYRAVFTGSGEVFGIPRASLSEDMTPARHRERSLYSGLWNDEAVASWIEILRAAIPPAFDTIMSIIPHDWHSGNLNAVQASSLLRLIELPKIIEAHSLADGSSSRGTVLGKPCTSSASAA